MPRLIWTPAAIDHLFGLHRFLQSRSERAADSAVKAIHRATAELEQFPEIGALTGRVPDHRNLIVRFGTGGYIVRYVFRDDQVIILWVRHQRQRRLP